MQMEKQDKQSNQLHFIYPVPFQDFVGYRRKQSEAILMNYNVKELNKIRKLKKILQATQEKISNRINLFKKVSMNIQKKREKENIFNQKIEKIKQQTIGHESRKVQRFMLGEGGGFMRPTKSSASLRRIKQPCQGDKEDLNPRKVQLIIEEKHDKAKSIKMWKQRNKIVVEQRRLREMREKVQSANLIRHNRNRAKQVRHLCQQQKHEEVKRLKQKMFKEEVEKYDILQQNLTKLQREEREALMMWKYTMESQNLN